MSNFYQENVLPAITWANNHSRITHLTPDRCHRSAHFALAMADNLFPQDWKIIERFNGDRDRFFDECLRVNFMGIDFDSPFGISAGWTKNGEAARGLYRLGAGWVALGGIKPEAEKGNNGTVLWVDKKGKRAQNHYGMPGKGVEKVVQIVQPFSHEVRLIGNLAMPRAAKAEEAPEIFSNLIRKSARVLSVGENNLSCPNQEDREKIQKADLAGEIIDQQQQTLEEMGVKLPLSIKIAPPPDISLDTLEAIADLALRKGIAISAFNTITNPQIKAKYGWQDNKGGVSGADPDYQNLTTLGIAFIYHETGGQVPIIGLGGIDTPEQAMAKIRAGATLVGGVTAFRSEGPFYPTKIARGLAEMVRREGAKNIHEFVGIDANRLYDQIRREGFSITVL